MSTGASREAPAEDSLVAALSQKSNHRLHCIAEDCISPVESLCLGSTCRYHVGIFVGVLVYFFVYCCIVAKDCAKIAKDVSAQKISCEEDLAKAIPLVKQAEEERAVQVLVDQVEAEERAVCIITGLGKVTRELQ